MAGAGGYDAEVNIYHSDNSSDSYVGTIVSGDFSTLSAMIADDTPPNILVRFWDDMDFARYSLSAVSIYFADSSSITFVALWMGAYGLSVAGNRVVFNWNANDTISGISTILD